MLDCYLPAKLKISATGERNRRRTGSSNSPFQIMLQSTSLFPKPRAVPNICPCSAVTCQYLRTELKGPKDLKGGDKFHIKEYFSFTFFSPISFQEKQKTKKKDNPHAQNQLSHQNCYS